MFWYKIKRQAQGLPANERKTAAQIAVLEEAYRTQPYPDGEDVEGVAESTGLTRDQVRAWFQTKRVNTGQTELNDSRLFAGPPVAIAAAREKHKRLRKELC